MSVFTKKLTKGRIAANRESHEFIRKRKAQGTPEAKGRAPFRGMKPLPRFFELGVNRAQSIAYRRSLERKVKGARPKILQPDRKLIRADIEQIMRFGKGVKA